MSGTIAYCSREDSSYPLFASFLAKLAQRHPDVQILPIITNDVAYGRNAAVMEMAKAGGEWIWFIDTDMAFAPETLERLLSYNVDCVQVLCLKRHFPHQPILYEHGSEYISNKPTGFPGLRRVKALGAGGTLYRLNCFKATNPGPWFEGILGMEDTNFARKLYAKGVEMYCDLSTPVGHTTPVIVWPEYDASTNSWHVRYDFQNAQSVQVEFPESQVERGALVIAAK